MKLFQSKFKKLLKSEEGQAMAETAVVLPIITAIFLGILIFGFVMYAKIVVVDAARDGARHYALGLGDPTPIVQEVITDGKLNQADIESVTTSTSGDYVTVSVSYLQDVFVPGIGTMLGGSRIDDPTCTDCIRLQSTAVFKKEN
jgi:hypothetical protein